MDAQVNILLEHMSFGRMLDPYSAKANLAAHNAARGKDQRRLHFVNLGGSLANSYETLAAILLAMKDEAQGRLFFNTLLTYRQGTAKLKEVLGRVRSIGGFCRRFRISRSAIKRATGAPTSEVDSRLNDLVRSIRASAKDQLARIDFYNKTKHGKVIVRVNGHVCAIHYERNNPANKLQSTHFRYHRGQARILYNLVVKVSHAIADLVTLHIATHHSAKVGDMTRQVNGDWKTTNLQPIPSKRRRQRAAR